MRTTMVLLALACVASSCGGSGGHPDAGSGSGSTSSATFGIVHLLAHVPAADAVEVPVDTAIVLEFDSAIAIDSLGDEDTWLRRQGTETNLPGSFTLAANGQRVTFRPNAPLALETDYVFQVSGLTCDDNGRLLDSTETFTFRTLDTTPPTLLGLSVADQSTGQSRTGTFTYTFSEAIATASLTTASLYLTDVYGSSYPATRTTDGATVVFDPHADLPGDRLFTLVLTTAVTDRAGNAVPTTSTVQFTTANDADQPSVTSMWPAQGGTGISPAVQPTYTFSESMDPNTVEPSSLVFQDQFGSVVPFAIHASDDQRTLRVRPTLPLEANRRYTLAFLLGGAAATDVTGNVLQATQALVFTTGSDAVAPTVVSSTPAAAETRVSTNAILTVTFDEALDPDWVDETTVRLYAGGELLDAVVERSSPSAVRITPVLMLPTSTACEVVLQGGHEGLHDLAGNVLAADHTFTFTTASSSVLPTAMLFPPDGASSVPRGARVSIVFDVPMDPATLTADTVQVCDDAWTPLDGTLAIGGGNRTVTFTPAAPFAATTYHRTRILGGSGGVRATTGSWFAADQTARFRSGTGFDTTSPTVHVTVNRIDDSRAAGLVVPPSGFTIEARVTDPNEHSTDMGSIEVRFEGTGTGPGAATLFAAATIDYATFAVTVPEAAALSAGTWTITVDASDLSGNRGSSTPLSVTVAERSASLLPFERTQVVWVRTDLDRDGSRIADFEEDMLRLGFATADDPLGTNASMRSIVLDGIIAKANSLYGRGARGEPLDAGSVSLRFTKRAPVAIPHMQMALGGLDPEGSSRRVYGDDSSGVLGRAFYDYRNANTNERNTGTSPGLGVFPAEMWLYQTSIHTQVWPSYQTVFAQRFRPLCPDMGGTPAGSHAHDAAVLSPSFDYAIASSPQRARWMTLMQAADDWASVMGIILAHEVGHSVGLVAPGNAPSGLFGDGTLHDSYAGATEVMAPSVGYEAMISLDYAFRDIDLAYLRQRILLR